MKQETEIRPEQYLACESRRVFALLMLAGGYFGGFTYAIRGGVFCNAQTGNVVLLAIELGKGNWAHAAYYLLPITAYFLGAFVSEWAAVSIRRFRALRWETLLVMIEMAVVLILGLLPESAPVQITQVAVNLICSMQFCTFRQARGIPMATTFCTNHLCNTAAAACRAVRQQGEPRRQALKALAHLGMIAVFAVGCALGTVFSSILLGRAIWLTLIPMGIVLANLLYADLKTEKGRLAQAPHGR